MFVAIVRERQGQRVPEARAIAPAAPAIFHHQDYHASEKLKNTTCRPSYLDDGCADPLVLLVCRQGHRGPAFARLNGVFARGPAKKVTNRQGKW